MQGVLYLPLACSCHLCQLLVRKVWEVLLQHLNLEYLIASKPPMPRATRGVSLGCDTVWIPFLKRESARKAEDELGLLLPLVLLKAFSRFNGR